MSHALAFGRCHTSNVGHHRLGHIGLDIGRGLLFGRTADLTDHDHAVGLGVAFEAFEQFDESRAADRIAAEHLEILTEDPDGISARVRHAGGVFIGGGAGEVFGDYGIGPNHVLPTGGTARFTAGLSVLDFLRVRTWLRAASAVPKAAIVEEIATFARLEGLEGHAQAAEVRLMTDRIVPPVTSVAD